MPFLSLNGITCPVSAESGADEMQVQGEGGRGLNGNFGATVYTRRKKWELTTKPLASRAAVAWERLAMGLGHRWSFVDGYSSKHLFYTNTGTAPTFNGASGKFDKRMTVPSNSTVSWTLGVEKYDGLTGDYTVSVWHEDSGPAWAHYLFVRAAGVDTWYLAGALQGGARPAWFAVDLALGKVTLGEAAAATAHAFSEMVVHPFAIGETTGGWVTSFSGATVAHPDLPTLRAAGDLVAEAGVTSVSVEAALDSVKRKPAPHMIAGVWDKGAKTVSFNLEEV